MRDFIAAENEKIRGQALWRSLNVLQDARAREIVLDGVTYLNLSSNDYLGYSRHPEVVRAAQKALERYGAGGRSSRLISGTLDLHAELEERLARFKGAEAALLFPTGFMANLGVVSALLGPGDAILADRLNHASLIDAAKLSGARLFVYEHASAEALERVLRRTRSYKKRLVASDSLFSMDGDCAPLKEMAALCKSHGVWLMIDDAHATGVMGVGGIGCGELLGVLGQVDIVMGTLSKALGSQGGFVCGPRELIQFLANRSRPFIYTTAISPPSCAAALAALDLIGREPGRRKKLLGLAERLQSELANLFPGRFKPNVPAGPIVPFPVGRAEDALELARRLKEAGIYAPAIRPPTVPKDESRLRFSLTSEHGEEDVRRLAGALAQSAVPA